LTVTPVKGWKFKQWNDGNTNNPRTVTVTAAATYTATLEMDSIPVYVSTYQCSAVYVDEANKIIYFYGKTGTTGEDIYDTIDGWHLKPTYTIPTGDKIKAVEKIYIGTTRIL
jgi:hypothetical protein